MQSGHQPCMKTFPVSTVAFSCNPISDGGVDANSMSCFKSFPVRPEHVRQTVRDLTSAVARAMQQLCEPNLVENLTQHWAFLAQLAETQILLIIPARRHRRQNVGRRSETQNLHRNSATFPSSTLKRLQPFLRKCLVSMSGTYDSDDKKMRWSRCRS